MKLASVGLSTDWNH